MADTPENSQRSADDQQFEQLLGTLLICGVVAAAIVVLLGGVVYLARHGAELPSYKRFQGGSSDYRTLRGIVQNVLAGRGRGLIQLGIVMLIATPVARVALSLVAFLRRRDYLYTVFTLIVLGVLIFSLSGKRL
jgi:uncharacterized membrane protein